MPAHLTLRAPLRRVVVQNVRCAAVGLLLAAAVTACGDDSPSAYCGVVKAQQQHLSQVLGESGDAALLDALPTFEQLERKAPADISEDWTTVLASLQRLQRALQQADVDPTTYDAKKPPAGLTPTQQQAIATAATAVGSATTLQALQAVQQQVRDVCHTPLTL